MDIQSIILLAISILFLIMGFFIKYLKFYFLIAGYNTMDKEDKRLIDIEGLSKLLGNYFFITGTAGLISMVLRYLRFDWSFEIYIGFIILSLPYLLWKAQKYDKRVTDYKDYKPICIIITIVIFIFYSGIISLLYYVSQDQSISLSSDSITISSPYSDTINLKDIKDIKLKDSLPEIRSKINGINGINHVDKGYFNLDGLGEAKLYIHDNISPFIFITTDNNYYIINCKNSDNTKNLYNEIILKLERTR